MAFYPLGGSCQGQDFQLGGLAVKFFAEKQHLDGQQCRGAAAMKTTVKFEMGNKKASKFGG